MDTIGHQRDRFFFLHFVFLLVLKCFLQSNQLSVCACELWEVLSAVVLLLEGETGCDQWPLYKVCPIPIPPHCRLHLRLQKASQIARYIWDCQVHLRLPTILQIAKCVFLRTIIWFIVKPSRKCKQINLPFFNPIFLGYPAGGYLVCTSCHFIISKCFLGVVNWAKKLLTQNPNLVWIWGQCTLHNYKAHSEHLFPRQTTLLWYICHGKSANHDNAKVDKKHTQKNKDI